MDDTRKTKPQLIAELHGLRQRVAALEAEALAAAQRPIEPRYDELFARLQLILDSMPLGGIIIDPDLRVSYWNAAAEKIFGYTAAEVLGRLHYEVTVPENTREYVSNILSRTIQSNRTTFGENENVTKAGTRIVCEWHNTPLRDAAGRYVGTLAMAQDITARKQAEEKLRTSEERYRSVIQTAMDGFWLLDLQGHLLQANDTYCQMSGYSLPELLTMCISDLDENETPADAAAHIRQLTAAGQLRFITRHRRKDGNVYDVEVSAQYQATGNGQIVCFLRDITERRRAEEALREGEERWRTIVESEPECVKVLDCEGQVVEMNPAGLGMIQATLDDVRGKRASGLVAQEDRASFEEMVRAVFRGETQHLVFDMIGLQGRRLTLETVSVPLWDPAEKNRVKYLVGVTRDITARKRMEEQLRASAERFRIIASNSPDHLLVQDRELRYQMVMNPQLGLTEQDMLGKTDWDFLSREDAATLTRLKQQVMQTGEAAQVEVPLKSRQGEQEFFEGTYVPKFNADGQIDGLIGYFRNVTERKRTEAALRENEEKYRDLFENMNDAFALHKIIVDENGQPVDYEFLDVNPVFARRVGMTPAELIGRRALELFPQTEPTWIAAFGEVAHTRRSLQFTNYSVELDKHFETRIYCPRPGYFAAIFADITERKRAEEALRESEILLRTAVEAAPIILFTLDTNGIFQLSKGAGLKSIGLKPDEVVGLSHLDVYKDLEPANENVRRALQGETVSFINEALGLIWDVRYSPLYDSNNNIKGMVGTAIDVTERKRTEEQLLRSQKLESLGILAGGVAHDFNNLLVALLGQTSLAAAKLPPDHPAQRHLERAIVAARRAADLTRQMLAYSGHGAFQMTPLNLNTLIHENTGFLESSIAKSIQLRADLAETLPLISADPGQMQQIIMNLVLNAAEAMGDQAGVISITTSVTEIMPDDTRWTHYTGQVMLPGRYVQLRVQDTGSGMNGETLGRIFDPFFTTKFTGRGLGLAAVLGIMRGHRGGLWVESEVGRGTTFTLIFPVTEEKPATPASANPIVLAQQLVLVIDDEEPVLEAITDMLALDNISVLGATTASEGIALFRERYADIGLVLLDLSMPELSGREVFHALKQIDPDARVVLTSGYTQAEATRGFEEHGLAGFLQKPFDISTLLETVRLHLESTKQG